MHMALFFTRNSYPRCQCSLSLLNLPQNTIVSDCLNCVSNNTFFALRASCLLYFLHIILFGLRFSKLTRTFISTTHNLQNQSRHQSKSHVIAPRNPSAGAAPLHCSRSADRGRFYRCPSQRVPACLDSTKIFFLRQRSLSLRMPHRCASCWAHQRVIRNLRRHHSRGASRNTLHHGLRVGRLPVPN